MTTIHTRQLQQYTQDTLKYNITNAPKMAVAISFEKLTNSHQNTQHHIMQTHNYQGCHRHVGLHKNREKWTILVTADFLGKFFPHHINWGPR